MMVSDRFEDDAVFQGQSPAVLKASAIVQRLRGLHTVLVKASDGLLYVVKMMDSFQGPNALANEALGYELANYLGLAVPDWRPIEISESSVDKYLLLHWTGSDSWLDRPGPGLYFGSRAIGLNDQGLAVTALPEDWLNRISNRSDFAGMLLLDLWANQVGPRKALFVPSADRLTVTAFFFDNSQLFGGFWGREELRRGESLHRDRRVYANLDVNRIFNQWLQKAIALDEKMLLQMARLVPRQWHHGSYLQEVASQLQVRKWRVAQLLAQEVNLLAESKDESVFSDVVSNERRTIGDDAGGSRSAKKQSSDGPGSEAGIDKQTGECTTS